MNTKYKLCVALLAFDEEMGVNHPAQPFVSFEIKLLETRQAGRQAYVSWHGLAQIIIVQDQLSEGVQTGE